MNNPRFAPQFRLSILLLAPLLAACTVGPDYVAPLDPDVPGYTRQPLTQELGSGPQQSQTIAPGSETPVNWWEAFGSADINNMVTTALAGSPTIAASQARLTAAQATVRQTEGGLYPQLDGSSSVARRQSGDNPANDLYALGAVVSFDPDLFGLQRSRVRQSEASARNAAETLAVTRLTVAGNIVQQAVTLAQLRAQLAIVKNIIADDEKNLTLVRQKLRAGKAAQTDILSAESQLANDRTQLAPLRQQKNVAQHALALLMGKFPAQWTPPKLALDALVLPPALPVTVPSALVHKRPDIRVAEADLQAANAAIGVATAQMYPDINLSGSLAAQALSTATLFNGSSLLWNIAADLAVPIFHGGALEAQEDMAQANYQATLATYQQTVLTAFGQVADLLRALKHDAQQQEAAQAAYAASDAALKLQRLSYGEGKTDLLQLLDAQRGLQQASLGLVRARAQRLQDTAALAVAMGGGMATPVETEPKPTTP